jgi:hypothetical protein
MESIFHPDGVRYGILHTNLCYRRNGKRPKLTHRLIARDLSLHPSQWSLIFNEHIVPDRLLLGRIANLLISYGDGFRYAVIPEDQWKEIKQSKEEGNWPVKGWDNRPLNSQADMKRLGLIL